MRRVVCILLFFVCMLASGQTKKFSRAAIDSLQQLKTVVNNLEVLRFDAYSRNLGAMFETDSVREVCFSFRNVSDAPVRILKTTVSCGCTAARFDSVAVLPGEEGTIKIFFNPKGKVGTLDTDAFVYLEGYGDKPVTRLVITGNVIGADEWKHLPVVMGQLRVKRNNIEFTDVANGKYVERIVCANAGLSPLRLTAKLLPSYMTLVTAPLVLQPGEEGDIVITVDGGGIPTSDNDTIRVRVVLEGIECNPLERTLYVMINRDKNKR